MSEQWVIRWDEVYANPNGDIFQPSAKKVEDARKWPSEVEARKALAGLNGGWRDNAVLERVDVPNPVAKGDVEALLMEVDRRRASGAYDSHPAHEDVREWTNGRIAIELAAAFRAAQERAERNHRGAVTIGGLEYQARRHLCAVLALFRDDSAAPEVVAGRAFLAGEVQAPRHDDVREIELLRKELADKGAALVRMQERYEREYSENAKATRAYYDAVAAQKRLEGELAGEREYHEKTMRRALDAEKDLDVERNVHAQTKRELDHAKKMMTVLTDQRVLSFVDASLTHGTAELVPKSELEAAKFDASKERGWRKIAEKLSLSWCAKFREEEQAHARTKRDLDSALETVRVLRLRIDGIADVPWKDLPR